MFHMLKTKLNMKCTKIKLKPKKVAVEALQTSPEMKPIYAESERLTYDSASDLSHSFWSLKKEALLQNGCRSPDLDVNMLKWKFNFKSFVVVFEAPKDENCVDVPIFMGLAILNNTSAMLTMITVCSIVYIQDVHTHNSPLTKLGTLKPK